MGLDITAYRKLTPVQCEADDCYPAPHARIYHNADFPTRADGVAEGCHTYEDEMGFRAGSYGGYSIWRNELAALAQYPRADDDSSYAKSYPHTASAFDGSMDGKPFAELVNFSDCEGTIGPVVSAKLAADFATFQPQADAHGDDYFREKYAEWRAAFEMAADGGAVCFQ